MPLSNVYETGCWWPGTLRFYNIFDNNYEFYDQFLIICILGKSMFWVAFVCLKPREMNFIIYMKKTTSLEYAVHIPILINSLWFHWSWSSLVLIMTCCLIGTKPLPKLIIISRGAWSEFTIWRLCYKLESINQNNTDELQ